MSATTMPMPAARKQCSFTSKLELTDIYRDRLPSHSPYVGTFHRGHTVSDQECPTYDVNFERLLKSCPYIGSFNHNKRDVSSTAGVWNVKSHAHDASEDIRSQASTPPTAPSEVPADLSKRVHRSQSLGLCDESAKEKDAPLPPAKGSAKRKMYRHRSWADLTQFTKQQTPELCGLQAILPKECGVRILDKLGEGTFAKVVLALNKRNSGGWSNRGVYRKLMALPKEGEKLVLKCVRKEENMGDCGLECLQREVQLHSQCMHPNIPTMYGFYDDGRNVTMILDYIQGKELRTIISDERTITADRARLIMLQVLRALQHMHEKGFAHRDISPRNVLVSETNKAFLIDLGLAVDLSSASAAFSHSNADGSAPGTMGYVAPEAMRGEASSLKSDVWALGCILYEMVFGFSPFLPHEVLSAEAVPFPDASWGMDCPPDLEDLIRRMLHKDVRLRCSAAEALAHASFGPALQAQADALCAGDQRRREEERAACPPLEDQDHAHWSFPPLSPARPDRPSTGPGSPPSCLAVNLEIPKSLESTVGDHHNFLATVMYRGNSIDEED